MNNTILKYIGVVSLCFFWMACSSDDSEGSKEETVLSASFIYSVSHPKKTITFTNTSIAATSYFWNLGNGNTATIESPINVYAADGEYEVTLEAKNEEGEVKTFTDTIQIGVDSENTDEEGEGNGGETNSKIIMEDNFDVDGVLNSNIWAYDTGGDGWGNGELQYYTDRSENVKIVDGTLQITAKQESFEGAVYTSARIKTQDLFDQKYGRFEARIKLPEGQGIWPAFWMLGNNIDTVGWPQCGEIDIMEYRGQNTSTVLGTLHGPGYSGAEGISGSYGLNDGQFNDDFHIFAVEWSENSIDFYVDDVMYNQITPSDVTGEWVYDHPFFIVMNLAVGGSFVGDPNAQTTFPQTMYVDYVRVTEI